MGTSTFKSLQLDGLDKLMKRFDLNQVSIRRINSILQSPPKTHSSKEWEIDNPMGKHAVACGLNDPINVKINSHVGFYCGGMNQSAKITIDGHAGVGAAENMMSGVIRVTGNASQSAGASANGGLLVIEGDTSSRCGISMKGADIVVGGSVGHMSAFMAQSGNLVICGDAGNAFGDSIYEARLFVRGKVESLGSDCIEKEMRLEDLEELDNLIKKAEISVRPSEFKRFGSSRKLYNFKSENIGKY